MRICMVHNSYGSVSGEEMVVDTVTALLRDNRHEVIPFHRSSGEIPEMRFGRIRAFFNGMYSRSSRESMRRILAVFNPDVVHVHNLYPLISPSILQVCREMGFPVVMTTHNYRLVCPNGLLMHQGRICEKCSHGREWWCFLHNCEKDRFKSLGYALRNYIARSRDFFRKNVTEFVALTEFQRQVLIREGFPKECIHVIPNTISQKAGQESGALGNYVGYAGRISPEKDMPSLMEAARLHRNIAFRAAGAYDRLPQLLETAPDNFEFCGMLKERKLAEFYENCRIIVLCSVCYEGFPSVLAEAMAYGKPVVCSRIGGLAEIVEDGVTGLLFEPGNVTDLAAKIRHLWDRPDLCRQMGRAGREKAGREYSPENYYKRLIAVYEKAIELGPQQPRNN
ncbi:MAG: glycosyltransferase family 4 protein [Acidobacteria bacterium]|nr:glycosyltransferase family 4 protein [Acidobacteriota bacterium]